MTALGRCQSSQAMCIFYNVFEEAEKPEAVRRLLEFIEEKDGHYDCGYLGNRVIFHVLAMAGETELALNMITRPDYPSYVFPVLTHGATALWENYFDYKQNSLNHHFFGDISNFFIKRIAGLEINPLRRDVNEYHVHPYFAEALTYAKAHYDTVGGRVEVRWERDGEDIILTVNAPENSKGKIILPKGYEFISEKRNLDRIHVTPVKLNKYIIRKVVKQK